MVKIVFDANVEVVELLDGNITRICIDGVFYAKEEVSAPIVETAPEAPEIPKATEFKVMNYASFHNLYPEHKVPKSSEKQFVIFPKFVVINVSKLDQFQTHRYGRVQPQKIEVERIIKLYEYLRTKKITSFTNRGISDICYELFNVTSIPSVQNVTKMMYDMGLTGYDVKLKDGTTKPYVLIREPVINYSVGGW
jgi:hypothetical protein